MSQTTTPSGAAVDVLDIMDGLWHRGPYATTADEFEQARTAVAALIARNAELEADAARWREVARRFDSAKLSASQRVLEGLGIDHDEPWTALAKIVDGALARTPANGDNA